MKTVLKALIVSTALAAGGVFAEPTLVNDDVWLTGPKPSSPAPRAAASASKRSMHEMHMRARMQADMLTHGQTEAQKPPQSMAEILANQPGSFAP